MPVVELTAPAVEPVSLSEAKAFLRVGHSDEDALIGLMIRAARTGVESLTGRALIARNFRETLDGWPLRRFSASGTAFAIARPPLAAVTEVRVRDHAGDELIWDAAEYRVDLDSDPGRLIALAPFGFPRPGKRAASVEIDFTAGYGASADDVPAPLREAILLYAGRLYARGDAPEAALRGEGDPGETVMRLLNPYRSRRL